MPAELKRHIRSHSGERPYKCLLCHYSAGMKATLKAHVKRMHHIDLDESKHKDLYLDSSRDPSGKVRTYVKNELLREVENPDLEHADLE